MSLSKQLLPVFIGTISEWGLLGVLLVQTWIYFSAFQKDKPIAKALVWIILLIEVLETLANTRDTTRIFGIYWGDLEVANSIGWAWFSVPIIGSISAAIGQGFFSYRVYILSQRKLYAPALILALTMVQLAAGIWSGVEICLAKRFSDLQNTNVVPTALWLGTTSLCDLIIVGSTTFYLLKSRSSILKSTNAIIYRVVKISVETGMICALFAIFDLYLFVTFKGANYHLALCIELSKIYSNSILAIMNSRAHITHGAAGVDDENLNLSAIDFRAATKIQIPVDINESGLEFDHTHTESEEVPGGYAI
ncbi:hypothetical protein C8R46DRAFT_1299936 [Mycena filopes]|nr:hypothetical protein C8R46DRAFT_1299936 [Mycena filopes]